MSGTSTWRKIRDKRVGDDPERVERARQMMLAELRLAELRKHRHISQATLAKRLDVSQSNISQFERGNDIRLSTLKSYVQALGGHIEIRAVFDDETLPIS